MAESNKEQPDVIQVPAPPSGGVMHIHVDKNGEDREARPISLRSIGSWIAGGVGVVLGWLGAETYIQAKMWDFDGKVDNLVRNDIMNRKSGIGAAVDSAGSAVDHSMPLGGFGPGISSHNLRLAHEYNVAQSGQYPFARFVKKFGSWPITFSAAAITGGTALLAYFALAPTKRDSIEQIGMGQEPLLIEENLGRIAKDSVNAVGVPELLQQLKTAENDPEKQQQIMANWQEKVVGKDALQPARGA